MLKTIFEYANYDRQKFMDFLEKAHVQTEDTEIKKAKSRLSAVESRLERV